MVGIACIEVSAALPPPPHPSPLLPSPQQHGGCRRTSHELTCDIGDVNSSDAISISPSNVVRSNDSESRTTGVNDSLPTEINFRTATAGSERCCGTGSKEAPDTGNSCTPEMLSEINRRWSNVPSVERSGEILVKFSSEPVRVVWEPEHLVQDLKQARISDFQTRKLDKERMERMMRPVLATKHRDTVFKQRFAEEP